MKDARQILSEILSERVTANPSYSLRAFARDLKLSAPQLSNVMNGHRGLSPEAAERVSGILALDARQRDVFLSSLKARFSPRKAERVVAQSKLNSMNLDSETKYLDLDLFKVIASWHHFALIELIRISKNKKRPEAYFAEKLELPENEVRLALGRLERLNLIVKTAKGYVPSQFNTVADHAAPTDAVKKFHRQVLEKSIQALAFQGAEERYGYSAAMPVKVKSVARAKKLIQKFRFDFAKEISDSEGGEEIYGFCLQFFRLSKKLEKQLEKKYEK